jgi:probable F420-dependent oxidoreductase
MSSPEPRVRIGAQIQPHHQPYDAMRRAWRHAEQLGIDTLFTWDHLFPRFGDPDGPSFEGWTSLAAMAEVTERVEIGVLVTAVSFRNPNLLADMARTVDHASGGRLILGIGAGGFELDYEQSGYPATSAKERLAELEESLPTIRRRVATRRPSPVRGTIPILVGGVGERVTLRIVAQYADIWNAQGEPEELARLNGVLNDWCGEVGRDPDEIERSVLLIQPRQVERADDYLAAGFTHLIYSVRAAENDFSPVEALLSWRSAR